MSKISRTYRLFSALVALLVFAGASLPSGLHQKTHKMEMCETMDSHTMMQNNCDIGIACACSIEQAPVKTESKIHKTSVLIKAFLTEFVVFGKEQDKYITYTGFIPLLSDLAEASPPIFLKNSSFLN